MGYTISNCSIDKVQLASMNAATVQKLVLSGIKADGNVFLKANNKGEVLSAADTIDIDKSGKIVFKSSQGISSKGPLLMNDNNIVDAAIKGGTIESVKQITAHTLIVNSLQPSASGSVRGNNDQGDGSKSGSLLYADSTGRLVVRQASIAQTERVEIPILSVNQLEFLKKEIEIDFNGATIKNAKMDSSLFENSKSGANSDDVSANSITIHSMSSAKAATHRFISVDKAGQLRTMTDLSLDDSKLIMKGSIEAEGTVSAAKIQLPNAKNALLLGTDSNGNIQTVTQIVADTITPKKSLVIPDGASVSFQGLKSSLLAVDKYGNIVAVNNVPSDSIMGDRGKSSNNNAVLTEGMDIDVKVLTASSAKATNMYTDALHASSIYLDSNNGKEGSIFVLDSTGKMVPFSGGYFDLKSGALHIQEMKSVSTSDPLKFEATVFANGVISNSNITNSIVITTQSLRVDGMAEFLNDVVVDGSVTVHGNLIGSGSFLESSDRRFKTNIVPINGALEKISKLNAVRFIASV